MQFRSTWRGIVHHLFLWNPVHHLDVRGAPTQPPHTWQGRGGAGMTSERVSHHTPMHEDPPSRHAKAPSTIMTFRHGHYPVPGVNGEMRKLAH